MKKIYVDISQLDKAIGLFVNNEEIELIPTGSNISIMPIEDQNEEYQQYAHDYDIHFIFDDDRPKIDFYSVPYMDIIARDSDGGYIGTLGQTCDLRNEAPICYINKDRKCYFIALNKQDFLEKISHWKTCLKPFEDIKIYKSKDEAMKHFPLMEI